jgi:flagellar biosynthetic protein FliQ
MTQEFVLSFAQETFKLTILISAPMLLMGLVAGLAVSIFQAVTSINEMTLTFIPKILAVFLSILMFFPWILKMIVGFTQNIIINLPLYIK